MGMYDDIRCKYPLPTGPVDGWQTKDTPAQYLDLYEIRTDGTLWHEEYEFEDHSDPEAEGAMALAGCMTRVNKRWVQCNMTGEIRFYQFAEKSEGWIEHSAYFVGGTLRELQTIENRAPTTPTQSPRPTAE